MNKSDDSFSRPLNIHEAAEFTGLSLSTLRRKIKKGTIKAEKVKSRYGEEYVLAIEELDKLKKRGGETPKTPAKTPPKAKTGKKIVKPAAASLSPVKGKSAASNQELGKITALQNQEMELLSTQDFDREKFQRNWLELGRLIEAKISEGQLELNELSGILQEKERLLSIRNSHIKHLNHTVEEQVEEIEVLHKQKSLLRQFAEYMRSLFVDLDD